MVILNSSSTASGPGRDATPRAHASAGALPPFGADREIPAPGIPGYGVPRYEPARYDPPAGAPTSPRPPSRGRTARPAASAGVPGLLTSPTTRPARSSSPSGGPTAPRRPALPSRPGTAAGRPPRRRQRPRGLRRRPVRDRHPPRPVHAAPAPAPGVWDRLRPREDVADDAQTVAHPTAGRRTGSTAPEVASQIPEPRAACTGRTTTTPTHTRSTRASTPRLGGQTGGLEVIGAHVEEDPPRRRRRRRAGARGGPRKRRCAPARPARGHRPSWSRRRLVHDEAFDEDIPVVPYDRRTGRGRRKRSPVAVLVSLLVLAGLVVGIVVGGQKLLALVNPASRDYTGGTGRCRSACRTATRSATSPGPW